MLVCIMVFSTTIKYEYFDIDGQDYKFTGGSSLTLSLFDEKNDPATNYTSGGCHPVVATVGTKIVYTCHRSNPPILQGLYASDGHNTSIELFSGQISNAFTVVDDVAYFTVNDGSGAGYELFSTDGTQSGTSMVKDINPYGNSEQAPIRPKERYHRRS